MKMIGNPIESSTCQYRICIVTLASDHKYTHPTNEEEQKLQTNAESAF